MGYMTTITILNDVIDTIHKNPLPWWEATRERILGFHRFKAASPCGKVYYGWDSGTGILCANQGQVVQVENANVTSIIAVGGNDATVLSTQWNVNHQTHEDKEKILRQMAEEMGYVLHKKPNRDSASHHKAS